MNIYKEKRISGSKKFFPTSVFLELTEKVNQLLLARETVPAPITVTKPEDEFITTRAPASELKIYPMLKDALPSIEEDFFRIQLTEEERKDAIYSCPRSSFMNYLPPPLNESASTAVKKADSTLHGIQVALAQATRPVDYYVHRIIQDNPGITADDPRFLFADTMRARAIGATLAATSGVPVENIVSHAFWSNYNMFDTYYRLDRSTQSNMTEAVLPLE
ncbi:hypothetical protein BB561_003790 [Smittium simulii]|uniref:Uncharacterized protein n=1 Tax=Smittium simulii TaxID=133385 RepID=A0A2T9YJI8_9FUNG|nr:hypothetical protein BB561_003790 [Smittium simulii]